MNAKPRWSAIYWSCSAAIRILRPSSTPAPSTPDVSSEQRKPFLLRIPPDLLKEIEKWAADDLRSVNAQMEFVLRQAVARRKGVPKEKERGVGVPEASVLLTLQFVFERLLALRDRSLIALRIDPDIFCRPRLDPIEFFQHAEVGAVRA